jgi:hypothetical protein
LIEINLAPYALGKFGSWPDGAMDATRRDCKARERVDELKMNDSSGSLLSVVLIMLIAATLVMAVAAMVI